jgi:hypothetical protein
MERQAPSEILAEVVNLLAKSRAVDAQGGIYRRRTRCAPSDQAGEQLADAEQH